MDECNMCHPEMKAPTLATCRGSTFQGNFQSPIFVRWKFMLCFFFKARHWSSKASTYQRISEIPKTRKAEEENITKCVKVCYMIKKEGKTQCTDKILFHSFNWVWFLYRRDESKERESLKREVCFSLRAVNSAPDCWMGRLTDSVLAVGASQSWIG